MRYCSAYEGKIQVNPDDLQRKCPKLPKQQQSKKSAVAIAHPAFSVYNLRGCNIEAFITDPEGREIARETYR